MMMMMMQIPLLALLVAAVAASDIQSHTRAGQRLMSKAQPLHKDRALADNDQYTSWMTKYSMKFNGCHSVPQFERDEGLRSVLLAKFKMCPSDDCNKCKNSGDYVVEMRDFIEAYQEAQMSMNEYACESAKEYCEYQCENGLYEYQNQDGNGNYNNANYQNNNNNNNNNDGDNYCYYTCMSDKEMSYCDNENNDNDMNVEELVECRPLGGGDNNNNQNQYQYYNSNVQLYYVGAYCTDSGVFLGTFQDSTCTTPAPSGTYEKYSGYSLPTENLVGADCISCKSPENDNNNNNNNNNGNNNNGDNNNNAYYQDYYGDEEVFDVCEQLYEDAGKCETNLDIQYKNTYGCEMMHKTLARLDNAYHNKGTASVVLAWLFAVVIVFLAGYIYWIHTKVVRKQSINLSSA